MLSLVDNLLRQSLMDGVVGLQATSMPPAPPAPLPPVTEDQVGFRPPDDQWVKDVKNLQLNALNVYLVDLRENRNLRSNERERSGKNGVIYSEPAPARIDCHYLITAWSPTEDITPLVEPVLDEHVLLYEVAALLLRARALNPSRAYPPNSAALNAWPERFRDSDLPIAVAPQEGFPKLAEFWGTMGHNRRWKPAVYLIVTLPVELLRQVSGPMVTTRITEYRQTNVPESGEVWIDIGGTVYDKAAGTVSGAWVGLETTTGKTLQTTKTNELGRFTFGDLQSGTYVLRARAVGLGELTPSRKVDVPSPSGEYDLHFT